MFFTVVATPMIVLLHVVPHMLLIQAPAMRLLPRLQAASVKTEVRRGRKNPWWGTVTMWGARTVWPLHPPRMK